MTQRVRKNGRTKEVVVSRKFSDLKYRFRPPVMTCKVETWSTGWKSRVLIHIPPPGTGFWRGNEIIMMSGRRRSQKGPAGAQIRYRCAFSNTIRTVLQNRGWKEGDHDGDVSAPHSSWVLRISTYTVSYSRPVLCLVYSGICTGETENGSTKYSTQCTWRARKGSTTSGTLCEMS